MNKERLKEVICEVLRGRMPLSEQDKLADALGEKIAEREEELRGHAMWVLDKSFEGKKREIYRCTNCGHWQSRHAQREDKKKIMYMKYCPYCGFIMQESNFEIEGE